MFESARLKLTIFYLAILLVFSLLLTWGFRVFVGSEFNHANDVQRGAFHRIGIQFFDSNTSTTTVTTTPPVQPDQNFATMQRVQAEKTQARLTREAVLLNIGVFVVGAAVSYWYAGRALRPIEEAHERQKRFTSDASHELRTPLASMRLENEIFLRQKQFSDTEVREQIGSNLEEVARLERLTTSLLDLNRFSTVVLQKDKHDARLLAEAAIEHVQKSENAAHIVFKNTVKKVLIIGNNESLTQLLGIILDNAVKYGPTDGKIEVSSTEQAKDFTILIRDHGTGIGEADLPHVFERMYRSDKARSNFVSGHGIGLNLAKQIANANGTRIVAANHSKGGAVFSIILPKA